jgi:DNA-directed RNA polymerase subunit RPC12/RpoP
MTIALIIVLIIVLVLIGSILFFNGANHDSKQLKAKSSVSYISVCKRCQEPFEWHISDALVANAQKRTYYVPCPHCSHGMRIFIDLQ